MQASQQLQVPTNVADTTQASQHLRPPTATDGEPARPHSRNRSRRSSASSPAGGRPRSRNRSRDSRLPPSSTATPPWPTSRSRVLSPAARKWTTTRILIKEPQNRWPFALKTHMPELDDVDQLRSAMRGQQGRGLWLFGKETGVAVVRTLPDDTIEASFRGARGLMKCFESTAPKFELFYITMTAQGRLRIEVDIFKRLALCYELPVAFIKMLIGHSRQPPHAGFGSRLQPVGPAGDLIQDFWYTLPIRLPMACTDPENAHRDWHTGIYQINAFNHLHLHKQKSDLRHFDLVILSRHDLANKKSTVICVNLHSRTPGPIEVIQQRVLRALEDGGTQMIDRNPLWANVVYIDQVLEWWKVTFEFYAAELNTYEKQIEDKMTAQAKPKPRPPPTGKTPQMLADEMLEKTRISTEMLETNRALHAMASHCLRYKTELVTVATVVVAVMEQHEEISEQLKLGQFERDRVRRALKQQLAEVTAITRSQEELAKKTENTLALLFHSVQADYDQQQIVNGDELQKISLASQDEVKQTRKDSLAMKTIAVMTMFFLPGTSIAAILALPYFQSTVAHRTLWLWAVLAAAMTGIVLGLYHLLSKGASERHRKENAVVDPEKQE